MRKAIMAMTALLAIVVLSTGVASACNIFDGKVTCGGGCINLSWETTVSTLCLDENYIVERKCGSGAWVVIAEGVFNGGWSDCSGAACISGWTYRVTIECECGSSDTLVIGPETCP